MSQSIPQTPRPLEIGLSVRPAEDCPVRILAPDVSEVHHHAHEEGLQCEIVCAGSDGESPTRYHSFNDGKDPCPATIFMKHDSVPNVKRVENDALLIVTHPPSREAVQELLEDLQAVSDLVELKWLSDSTEPESDTERTVDLDLLTGKQLEAIELAVESGYYAQPRETTLSELAEACGISQSAMSQRLHTAERKLLQSIVSR
ncbi:MAG: helix-turn-helix domain-containing protein [Halodesulfurarchaeum sp.]